MFHRVCPRYLACCVADRRRLGKMIGFNLKRDSLAFKLRDTNVQSVIKDIEAYMWTDVRKLAFNSSLVEAMSRVKNPIRGSIRSFAHE